MKIEVKNLGPIKEGTISLEKDLILLTGPNNSGKSYLAYLVYGIMAIDKEADNYFSYSHLAKILEEDSNIKEIFLSKQELTFYELIKILNKEDNLYNKVLAKINSSLVHFNLRIFSSKKINPHFHLQIPIEFALKEEGRKSAFEYLVLPLNDMIKTFAYNFIHALKLPSTFFYPAERTALNMLAKEVYKEKSLERDEIAQLVLEEKWEELKDLTREKIIPRYPLAINDYLSFVYDLEQTSKNKSDFADFADEIEELLLKGKISLSQFGDIRFTPTGTEEILEIHVSSSLVKSLSGLILYLRHSAKKGDLIIIDEPELNLHPDNQRVMARVLARMVNKGFKLMVSTHSDYIIRQLNNLIMLHNIEDEKVENLRKYYGYEMEDTLDFNRVVSYFFNGNSMQEIAADEKGIDIPSIDTVVNDLNNESQDIYFSLYE